MSVTNPSVINMAVPEYSIDKIIAVYTGSISLAAPTAIDSLKTAVATHSPGFGDSTYFQGIFNVDGGTTYNDFGAMTPDTSGGGIPVFQTVGCNMIVSPTTVTVTGYNYYNFVTGAGATHTVGYKLYLMAKNTMLLPITPIVTSQALYYASAYNFQKIYLSGTTNLTVAAGDSGSVSVSHNLGYVPKVRAFRFDSTSSTTCRPLGDTVDSVQVRISTTSLTFASDQTNFASAGINANLEYRIYLDS